MINIVSYLYLIKSNKLLELEIKNLCVLIEMRLKININIHFSSVCIINDQLIE